MRRTHLLKAAVMAAVLSMAAPMAAQANTVTCVGTATLNPPTNYTSRVAGGVIVEGYDFTGVHDLCLSDGTVVVAALAGHVSQVRRVDGSGATFVKETLSIPGGTLQGIVTARFSATSFDATVVAYGGVGVLSGVTGHGTTEPTGPNTFISEIVYRYP